MMTPSPLSAAIEDGELRALAMTSSTRHPALPDVSTADEAGLPGVTVDSWFGFSAEKTAPQAVVERPSEECRSVAKDEALRRRTPEIGGFLRHEPPAQVERRVDEEPAVWMKPVNQRGIEPDQGRGLTATPTEFPPSCEART